MGCVWHGFGQAAGKGQQGSRLFLPAAVEGRASEGAALALQQERSSPPSALASSRKFSSAEGPRSLGAKLELCLKP